ncbi:MAG TPA: hypothetical protein PKH22_08095 [Leptospiraceae bacterium]|nr:hypothetical protein [Leptospiraceae bacterium]
MVDLKDIKAEYKVKFDTNYVRCISKHKVIHHGIHKHHENWSDED